MTDLELTKLCAKAMGYKMRYVPERAMASNFQYDEWMASYPDKPREPFFDYDPLHDDAQAMALVKKFHLHIGYNDINKSWYVAETLAWWKAFLDKSVFNTDLNRAIVECVAKMQQAKQVSEK